LIPGCYTKKVSASSTCWINLAMSTFETLSSSREEIILRQTDEITEISTPVIRVWNGILAYRSSGRWKLPYADRDGKSFITDRGDRQQHCISWIFPVYLPRFPGSAAPYQDSQCYKAMGAECIISGIRPEIAQTVVHLGIDLSVSFTNPQWPCVESRFQYPQTGVRKSQ